RGRTAYEPGRLLECAHPKRRVQRRIVDAADETRYLLCRWHLAHPIRGLQSTATSVTRSTRRAAPASWQRRPRSVTRPPRRALALTPLNSASPRDTNLMSK